MITCKSRHTAFYTRAHTSTVTAHFFCDRALVTRALDCERVRTPQESEEHTRSHRERRAPPPRRPRSLNSHPPSLRLAVHQRRPHFSTHHHMHINASPPLAHTTTLRCSTHLSSRLDLQRRIPLDSWSTHRKGRAGREAAGLHSNGRRRAGNHKGGVLFCFSRSERDCAVACENSEGRSCTPLRDLVVCAPTQQLW